MRTMFMAAVVGLLSGAAHAQSLSFVAKVDSVLDGGRVHVRDLNQRRHTVRLAGIEAVSASPEAAIGARRHLSAAIHGKLVRVTTLRHGAGERLLGQIWLDDVDVSLAQIESGHARTGEDALAAMPEAVRSRYVQAMAHAQAAGLGMWQQEAAAGSPPAAGAQ